MMIQLTKENTGIIACSMMKMEIQAVLERLGLDYPVLWMKKGMHEFPKQLHDELQKKLLEFNDKQYIILMYGLCGFSVLGLNSENASLIIPKFDDCIRILMSPEKGALIPTRADRIYLTKEWVDSDKFLFNELDGYVETYGEEDACYLAEMMIGGYSGVDFIDDGTYDARACCTKVAPRAKKYALECGCVKGSIRVIEKILTGLWDEEIIVVAPGREVCMDDFAGRAKCE